MEVKALKRDEMLAIGWDGDAEMLDLKSGVSYFIRGSVSKGYYHSDFMPKTRADAETMLKIAGGKWTWAVRPVILILSKGKVKHYIAGARHTYPHSIIVASNAFNIGASDLAKVGVSGSTSGWNIGAHFCFHYIDSLALRPGGANTFYTNMHKGVLEALQLGQELFKEDEMTQADFNKMMDVYLNSRGELGSAFPNDAAFQKDFAAAKLEKITDGTKPQAWCTREQAAVMAYRASR